MNMTIEEANKHLQEVREAYEEMALEELKASARAFVMDDIGSKKELIDSLIISEMKEIERMTGLELY